VDPHKIKSFLQWIFKHGDFAGQIPRNGQFGKFPMPFSVAGTIVNTLLRSNSVKKETAGASAENTSPKPPKWQR